MATPDRLERLTDLVLVLLGSSRPRTLEEIGDAVPGYPASHAARRQAFERDKRLLREEGVPVVTEAIEGPEQFGYRIDPDAFFLRDLHLEPDEQAALHLAVAGVHLGDPSGRDALMKLGAAGVAEARPLAAIVPPPALVPLFEALGAQAEASFLYRGERRSIAPAVLRFHGGRWYLGGWDRSRRAARTFRVDRVEGEPTVGPAGSGRLPEGFDAATLPEPWQAGEGKEADLLVAVDAVEADRVCAEVGRQAVQERRDDGSVLLRLGVGSPDAMRSWILGLLDHAVVVGPPQARRELISWLQETAATARPATSGRATLRRALPERPATRGAGAGGRTAAPQGAGSPPTAPEGRPQPPPQGSSARLRRLLAMVGWLARVREAPVAEIAGRFGMSEREVVRELELAACCGLPPYSPDVLLEIVVTDQMVQAYLPEELSRPRRLTPAEGLALAASARTILAVPGADRDGALARALAKLETALGDRTRLVVDLDEPPLLDVVRRAAHDRHQVEIEYHSASTDETTVRVVEPLAVVSLDGHWYLDAHCHRADGVRRFRVDRIRSARSLGIPSSARPDTAAAFGPTAFVPGPGSVAVRLRLDHEATWVADSLPVSEVSQGPGGTVEVTLAVGGTAWLERLLLQLGTHATVLSPPELADAGARAARRVLRRYEG